MIATPRPIKKRADAPWGDGGGTARQPAYLNLMNARASDWLRVGAKIFLDFSGCDPQFRRGNRLIGLRELPGRIEHHEFHERAVAI